MTFSPAFNPVFAKQGTTIFTVMSALAAEHKAVNLARAFPTWMGRKRSAPPPPKC